MTHKFNSATERKKYFVGLGNKLRAFIRKGDVEGFRNFFINLNWYDRRICFEVITNYENDKQKAKKKLKFLPTEVMRTCKFVSIN